MASDQDRRKSFLSLPELAVVVGIISVIIALLIPAVHRAREAARRTQSRNDLKQIGLALHNYHDCYRMFPPGGVFNGEGVGFHEWTTMIAPYQDSSSWYSGINFSIPWDDPKQVDLFRNQAQGQFHLWVNPSLPEPTRPDGLVSNHYAASQSVLFRNSSVSLNQIEDTASRLLVADAYGQFLPVGAPYGWRDVTLGLGRDPAGFGCSIREITHCLLADGTVRTMSQDTADDVLQAMAGPVDERPAAAQVARITEYPLIDAAGIWKADLRSPDQAGESVGKPYYVLTPPDSRPGSERR
ncbi:MAG: DUF1559 domain-containing protein [Planctomycetaceae bacterium]